MMLNCSDCKHLGKQICTVCCAYQGGIPDKWEPRPVTNGDRIRSMTDEELTEFLLNRDAHVIETLSKVAGFTYEFDRKSGIVDITNWLKKEAKDA